MSKSKHSNDQIKGQ